MSMIFVTTLDIHGSENMSLIETLRYQFDNGIMNKALQITGLPTDAPAWTIKSKEKYGVLIPVQQYSEFYEQFSNVVMHSEKNVQIGDQLTDALLLECFDYSLSDAFATLCEQFIEPGADNTNRAKITGDPAIWWAKWKDLLGNISRLTDTYSFIGELLTLEYLLKIGKNATWTAGKRGTVDIETPDCNYEVKSTVNRYNYEVTINSIYQLNGQNRKVNLVFCRFESDPEGTDLNALIKRLVKLGYSESELETALSKAHLERGCTARKQKYNLIEMKLYEVDDSFPAITESSFKGNVIPANIIRINYTVNLSGLPSKNLMETEQE